VGLYGLVQLKFEQICDILHKKSTDIFMDIQLVFQQMLILVAVMAVGFAIRRLRVLDEAANGYLTKLILRVTMPATLLSALAGSTLEIPLGEALSLFGFVLFAFVTAAIVSWATPWALRVDRDERGAYRVMGLFANVNFMGIPLAAAFFGPDGMFYVILYNIVFNLALFSVGMKLIGGARAKLSAKFFLSPILLSSVLSVVFFLLGIQLPYVLHSGLRLVGGITTPLAMILLGSVLGSMRFAEMFSGYRVYAVAAVRLIVAPVAVFFVLMPFGLSPLFLQVTTVMIASPTAASIATFAIHYDVHQTLVSKGIFISTLFSVVTMPLVLALLF